MYLLISYMIHHVSLTILEISRLEQWSVCDISWHGDLESLPHQILYLKIRKLTCTSSPRRRRPHSRIHTSQLALLLVYTTSTMSNANENSQYPYPQQYPNYCVKCGTAIPKPLTVRTVCTKCAVPIANWFDFDTMEDRPYDVSPSPPTQTSQQNGSQYHNAGLGERFETISLNDRLGGERRRKVNENSVEERFFLGALLVLEGHFQRPQTYMGKAMVEVKKMIASTLEMSLNKADVRETLAKNVSIWMRLKRIFYFGVPLCERRSLSSSHHESTTGPGQEVTESASLILKHSTYLCEDLHLLNSLLVISRNMLAIKETAQEICAAVGFDGEVKRLIELCVQVTSKGYDGENVVNEDRNRLMEVTELCEYPSARYSDGRRC